MGIKFASAEWMVALKDELNKSEGYRDAAKTWEGDFYWIITGMPGTPGDVYLYVDLWHGECRGANVSDATAKKPEFVIEATFPIWRKVVDKKLDPIQGMVTGSLHQMCKAEEAIKASEWSGSCECVRTAYPGRDLSILDLLPPGVSKGWALERLAARLGVDRKETMAIGDNWNDVDMLEWAGQGVIMGNADLELRTMAKTRGWKQAPPNDQDGVAVVLEQVLARRASAKV